jgi:parallel beta-helix repeat protein
VAIEDTDAHVVVRDNRMVPREAQAHGVRLAGADWGVAIDQAANVTVADHRIADHGIGGVLADGAKDVAVTGNDVEDEPVAGVHVLQTTNAAVRDNAITETGHPQTFRAPTGGVVADLSPDLTVASNTIQDNPTTGIRVEQESHQATVKDNTLENNDLHGLHVEEAARAHIAENNARGNGNDGLQVDADSHESTIAANTVAANGEHGIHVIGSDAPALVDNDARSNGADGLHLAAAPNAVVDDNGFEDTERAGIQLWASPHAELRDNAIDRGGVLLLGSEQRDYEHEIAPSNTLGGQPVVYLAHADEATVEADAGQVIVAASQDVTIRDQQVADAVIGIQVAHGENATVTGSTLANNQWDGLRVDETDNLHVEDPEIGDNGREGVEIRRSSNAGLESNVVHDNRRHGVYLYDTPESLVADNRVIHNGLDDLANGADGVRAWLSEDVTVEDNVVCENLGAGVRVSSCDGGLVHHNALVDDVIGVSEFNADGVGARENWWGCTDGAGARACDGTDGDILVEPWLTSPNPDAGVR